MAKRIGLAAAVAAAGVAAVVAAGVPAGIRLSTSPVAAAGTATPWMPRPIFGPLPVPQPGSAIGQTQKPRPAAQRAPDWGTEATPSFQAIQRGLTSLGDALNASDITAMQAACRQMSTAGAQFAATLPSPLPELTAQARAAVAEINQMSEACQADPPDIDGVVLHGNAANDHLTNVVNLSGSGD